MLLLKRKLYFEKSIRKIMPLFQDNMMFLTKLCIELFFFQNNTVP